MMFRQEVPEEPVEMPTTGSLLPAAAPPPPAAG